MRRIIALTVCLLAYSTLGGIEENTLARSSNLYGNWIPLPPPILKKPPYSNKAEKEIPRFMKRHSDEEMNPRQLYELALLNISTENYKEAKKLLHQALKKDRRFLYALIQLGYLNLWENAYNAAYKAFLAGLEEEPCDPRALEGLRTIGKVWAKEQKNLSKALLIYQKLYNCDSRNPDTLLFLGNILMRMKKWDQSEAMFKKCLAESPRYKDATLGLATLYVMQKKWDQAKALYEEYPDDAEANRGLARIESRQNRHEKALPYYKKSLSLNDQDLVARKEYARALTSSWRFQEAEDQYALYLTEDPDDEGAWNESFYVKNRTKLGLLADTNFTSAKENDPTLGVPVVSDTYSYTSFHTLVPVYDTLLFDIKWYFYNQKEDNIYNHTLNYDASLSGGQFTSHYLFLKNWRFDAYARVFGAWPQGSNQGMAFPFKKTTRFEPGISIIYDSLYHLAFGDLHVESFITKDFSTTQSIVLGLFAMQAHYLFRPGVRLNPEVEASLKRIQLFDGNFENLETLWLRFGGKILSAEYNFQHSHFNRLTANYFSYHNQYWNSIAAKLHIDLSKKTTFDAVYEHSWQNTYKLIQPIGDFIFVANTQFLTGDKITCGTSYRLKDHLLMKAEGHYFRNTLVYRDWNIKASLLWQF